MIRRKIHKNTNNSKVARLSQLEERNFKIFVDTNFLILIVGIGLSLHGLFSGNTQLAYFAIIVGVLIHILLKVAFFRYLKYSGREDAFDEYERRRASETSPAIDKQYSLSESQNHRSTRRSSDINFRRNPTSLSICNIRNHMRRN